MEAVLKVVENELEFEIEARREGAVYGFIHFRLGEPEGTSLAVLEWGDPRRVVRWVEAQTPEDHAREFGWPPLHADEDVDADENDAP